MKRSEEAALRRLQNAYFESLRMQSLYAGMCDDTQRWVRDATEIVIEVSKLNSDLGHRLAHVLDGISKTLSETDR